MSEHEILPFNKKVRELWGESPFFKRYLSLFTEPTNISQRLSEIYDEPMSLETRMEYLKASYLFLRKFGIKIMSQNTDLIRSTLVFDDDYEILKEFDPKTYNILIGFHNKILKGDTLSEKESKDLAEFYKQLEIKKVEGKKNTQVSLLVNVNSPEYKTIEVLKEIFEEFRINPDLLIFLPEEARPKLVEALEDMDNTGTAENVKKEKINFIVAVLLESVLEKMRLGTTVDIYLRFVIMLGRLPVDERGKIIYYFSTFEDNLQSLEDNSTNSKLEDDDNPLLRHGNFFSRSEGILEREIVRDLSLIKQSLNGLNIRIYKIKDYNLEDAERLIQGNL